MILNTQNTLLYVEPQTQKSDEPIVDGFTRKMTAAFSKIKDTGVLSPDANFAVNNSTMGTQKCICGANSDVVDFLLDCGYVTNSLCVHYLAWHRKDIPESELQKVSQLPDEEVEPSEDLLNQPKSFFNTTK